ncbi:hypothetical protein ACFRAO_40425 [Streptomyces sp. NPDC056656]|uniref:hypothetical protein n=1 Tax=Streptomyces sp. NPDC056656 TaxID=3345895 RepID=UPI00367F2B24
MPEAPRADEARPEELGHAHPLVRVDRAVVLVMDDEQWNAQPRGVVEDGETRPHVLLPRVHVRWMRARSSSLRAADIDATEIGNRVASDFGLAPQTVFEVAHSAVARTASGKPARNRMAAQLEKGLPG